MTNDTIIINNIKYALAAVAVKTTTTSLKDILLKHPDYPSLEAVADTLSEFNVENLAIRIGKEQLSEIPYPALCHLNIESGRFVVLESFENDHITYYDTAWGKNRKHIDAFSSELKWSGATLIMQANERSGDKNYKNNRKAEYRHRIGNYILLGLLSILFLAPVIQLSLTPLLLYASKLLGGFFCFILLQKQFGAGSGLADSFCNIGTTSSCDAVIHSPRSKIFGTVHLSELGALYFLGGVLLIITSTISNSAALPLLKIINLLVLPFTVFSIYYQWRVLKKWCPLCVLVMAVFWIEFIMLFQTSFILTASFHTIYSGFFSFVIPLLFWMIVRKRFINSFKIPGLEKKVRSFTMNIDLFQNLLNSKENKVVKPFKNMITSGAKNGSIELIVVSNPLCRPCALAHKITKELSARFEDQLTIKYCFYNASPKDADDTKMIQHTLSLYINENHNAVTRAMDTWFIDDGKENFNAWKLKNPLDTTPQVAEVNKLLYEHTSWCIKNHIRKTPGIFINGKELPKEFTLYDLKFQLAALMENEAGDPET